MKNALSVVLLVIFVLSPISATFAQKARPADRGSSREETTGVEFRNVSVAADRRGALIQWEMAAEDDALGYYVYRIDDGVPTLVSEKITLGAGMKPGAETSGGKYVVYDPAGRNGSAYYVEAITTA